MPGRAVQGMLLGLSLAVLGGCQPNTAPAAAVAAAGPDRPAWLPEHYVISPRSAIAPRPDGAEIVFGVAPGRCSGRRDAAGPADCATGARRSVLSGGSIYRVGHQYLHTFEIFVPQDFAAQAGRGRLVIARWQGADGARLFDLDLDAERGVTFRGQTCIPPSGFGQWQRVFVRLRWATDPTGFLELRCGEGEVQAAPLVHAAGDLATARTPSGRPVDRFEFQLGLIHEGSGGVPGPVEIRMRQIAERRLYVIFGLPGGI